MSGSFLEKIEGTEGEMILSEGKRDIFVMKITPEGELLWNQTYGGSGYDEASQLAIGEENQIYVTGWFSEEVDFGDQIHTSVGDQDVVLLNIDEMGQTLWSRRYGSEERDRGLAVGVRADGNIVVSGVFRGIADFDEANQISNGEEDVFFLVVSKAGFVTHVKSIGGALGDRIGTLELTENNQVIAAGYHMDSYTQKPMAVLYKLDASLNKIWARVFESSDASGVTALKRSESGEIFMLGAFSGDLLLGETTLSSGFSINGYLLALNEMGEVVSSVQLGGIGDIIPTDLVFAGPSELLVSGQFNNTLNLVDEAVQTVGAFDGFIMTLSL